MDAATELKVAEHSPARPYLIVTSFLTKHYLLDTNFAVFTLVLGKFWSKMHLSLGKV